MLNLFKSRYQKMIGVQFLGTLITLLDRYATMPILIYYWGLPLFGEWLLIRIIPTYLSIFEIGFPAATGNKIIEFITHNKHQEAANLYAVTARIMNYISGFVLVSIICIIYFGSPKEWLNLQHTSYQTLIITILLASLHTILIFRTQLLYALYRSDNQQVYWSKVIQLTRLGEFFMVVITTVLGGGFIAVSSFIVIARFFGIVYLTLKAKVKIPLYQIATNDTSFLIARPLLKAGFGFMLIPFAQAFNIQGFVWLIGVSMSPAMATIFNAYRIYSRVIFQVGDIIRRSLWAELTESYVQKQIKIFTKLLLNSIIAVIIIGFIISIMSYFLADYIILNWTLGKIQNDRNIMGLLLVISFLSAIRYVVFTGAIAINQHTVLVMIEAFFNLIAIAVLYYIDDVNFLNVSFVLLLIETLILICVLKKVLNIIQTVQL